MSNKDNQNEFNKKAKTSEFRRHFFGKSHNLVCWECGRAIPTGVGHVEYIDGERVEPEIKKLHPLGEKHAYGPVCVKKAKQRKSLQKHLNALKKK